MFDNQTTGQGNAPAPGTDDIFSGLDQGSSPAPTQPQAQFSIDDANAASQAAAGTGASHDPANKRLMLVGSIVVGLLLLAVGVWFALMNIKPKAAADSVASQADSLTENTGDKAAAPLVDTPAAPQNATDTAVIGNPAAVGGDAANLPGAILPEAIQETSTTSTSSPANGLAAEPAKPTAPVSDIPEAVKQAAMDKTDSDGDGLTDQEETQLGTYADRVDTDSDGLSDYEEVKTYLTNPKNPDTDGDSFKDGDEVKNGYNPKGTGKLTR
jgi:hypothetical protein